MQDDKSRAYRHFKKADPKLHAAALPHRKHLPSRLSEKKGKEALFDALASSIAGQQLSTKAASTIRERLRTACGGRITAAAIAKLSPAKLRAAGLSGAKTKSLKELAAAVQNGILDLPALRRIPEDEASAKLTSIWGIGPWTAEMFLMFALGRPDVFSAGDLGLVRAMEEIYGLPKNAPREKLLELSRAWSPHRTFASLILWRTRDNKPSV
ncbi:MAG TPA: DNA-3-methyladenine glycosylase [Candidatus Paceibacterota bacterium]